MNSITKQKIAELVLSGNMIASQLDLADKELSRRGLGNRLNRDLIAVWNERADALARLINTQAARQRPHLEPPLDYPRDTQEVA